MRALLSVALALVPSVSLACSPVTGYRVPTNIELVEDADLVVLATVKSGPDAWEDIAEPDDPAVVLEPVRAIKGVPPATLKVEGTLKDRLGQSYSLTPTPLNEPHPSAFWGACIRQAYPKGALVVAMFDKTPEGFTQLGHSFARSVEDVEDADALWVRTAELYARVLETNKPIHRRRAFELERNRLLQLAGDPGAQAIAADIENYLKVTSGKQGRQDDSPRKP